MDRGYSFKVVTYHTEIELIEGFVSKCVKYAYILHDKDIDEDGKLRSPHYHILCTFKQNKSFNSVRKLFPDYQNTLVKPMTDKVGDFLYLTHLNAPDKYQYSSETIKCNDLKYFEDKQLKSISNEEFINDLMPYSMLTYRQLGIKYGRDFMRNFKTYKYYIEEIDKQEREIERGYPTRTKFGVDIELLNEQEFRDDFAKALYEWYSNNLDLPDWICCKLVGWYSNPNLIYL